MVFLSGFSKVGFVEIWVLKNEFYDSRNYFYSALDLVISKIKVGTTVKPIWSRPQFFIKTWSYMSGELRECSNFKNLFVKIYKNLGFLGQSGL